MSLYNMLHGFNPNTEQLMGLLQLSPGDFGRYRDVYLKDGYIVVHTRNGGGNREDYEDVFDEMAGHPWYSHDEDCDFDCTYADIYFKIPDDEAKTIAELVNDHQTPGERWEAIFKALKS
jgi:hypothetical protein